MREGWTTKRLGDVGTFQRGGGFLKSDYVENGFPCIHYGQIHTTFGTATHHHLTCIPESLAKSKSKIAKHGDIILAITSEDVEGSCKCTAWLGNYDVAVGGHTAIFHHNLNPVFLSYYFKGRFFSHAKERYAHGFKVVEIKPSDIESINITYPPLAEQERIVAELDLLSGIIDKQKAQLKELDILAQSIFYDMFGNPVENDKGWETKQLSSVSTLINGRAYSQNELLDEGKYKILRVGNFFTNSNYYYSNLELEDDKYCNTGDLLFAWSASFGAFIWDGGKVIYHYHIWKVLYDKDVLDIQYYRFLLNTMTTFFMKDVHGIGMVHLTKAGMEQYLLPIPPLALQKSFADRIAAIEMQKNSINQSIAESQKLFDYTMDKYFS